MKWFPKGCPRKKTASSICRSIRQNGGLGRFSPVRLILSDSLNQLPEEAEEEYRFLDAQGILSMMATPLMANDHIWGYMGIDLVKSYHEWSNEDYQWFFSLANIIGICIELRKLKIKKIREQLFLNNLFRFMPMGYIHLSIIRDDRMALRL